MVNKHIVDYHPSHSQLTSRTHPLIYLYALSLGFISTESFLNFFLNLYIAPWLQKDFKFIVLRLLENIFGSRKIDSVYVYSYAKLNFATGFYHYPPEGSYSFLPNSVFWRSIFSPAEGGSGGLCSKKITKIKLTRTLFTSFDKFHHLCSLYIFDFFVMP